jgi:hypothetical protein
LEYKNKVIEGLKDTVDSQQKLVEVYEEVLKFYAYDALSLQDGGEKARKILENESISN